MIDERILMNIPGMKNASAVETISAEGLTEERFRRDYVDQNKPVLIKGAVAHWPAVKKWSDRQYLKDKVGGNKVNIYRHLNFSNDATMKANAKPETFADALDILHADAQQVVFLPFRVEAPNSKFLSLKEDIPGMKFLDKPKAPLFYPRARTFMYRGAGSGWHTHTADETLMCQISGVKRVGLLPTNNGQYAELKRIFFSDEYLDRPDSFAGIEDKIKPLVADVGTGDALYIPPSWWHGVQPLEDLPGTTMAYCWRSPLHKISDLRYPPVRELWRETMAKPGIAMLVLPAWGVGSMLAQLVYRVKCALRRAPAAGATKPVA